MSRVVANRYRLERRLGEGTHAEVWEAHDAITDERIAIKLMRRGGAVSARARREVAVLRILQIPGVVRMLDDGIDDGQLFVAMELVEGAPFPGRAIPSPWASVAQTTYALLETLARVHAAGIVHRDLKPANVLVTAEGRPVVLDFGLAFVADDDRLTHDGDIVGTPSYLAPEQIRGERVTPAADLYAVGVMLYETLSGRLPHEGRGATDVMRARLLRATPTLASSASIPEATARCVRRLLEPDGSDRPQDAREVLANLQGRSEERVGWLGSRAPIDEAVSALRSGVSVTVATTRASRATEEIVRALVAQRVRIVELGASESPFGSLAGVLGEAQGAGLSAKETEGLDEVERSVIARIHDAKDAVFLATHVDLVDGSSRRALVRAGAAVLAGGPFPGAKTITIPPLTAVELEAIFDAPNRIHHLAADAAALLLARTGGAADRVERELARWTRAGRCRWDRGRIRILRESLDRLEADPAIPDLPAIELGPRLNEVLTLVELADGAGDATMVSAVFARPRWEAEADLAMLVERGALSPSLEQRLRPAPLAPRDRQRIQAALARALPLGTRRLRHTIEACTDWAAANEHVTREAIAVAWHVAREGAIGRAVAVLGDTLALVRTTGAPPEHRALLLEALVAIGVSDATPTALDRMLYELDREASPRLEPLALLVRATMALQKRGRAMELADAVPPFAAAALERRRLALRAIATRRAEPEREEHVILEIVATAEQTDDAELRASARSWLGKLRYRQGRYAEAAELHLAAASATRFRAERIAETIHAASATQETFEHARALELANVARIEAERCRHAYLEARAEWLLRSVTYRMGDDRPIDEELLDAVEALGATHLVALVAFVEATHGYRRRDARVGELARRSHAAALTLGDGLGMLLAGALATAVGELTDDEQRRELHRAACASDVPGIGIQTAALLVEGGGPCPDEATIARLAGTVPRAHWSKRMELLSVDEALARLRR